MKFDEININDKIITTKIISEQMIKEFAQITGDYNAIHMDLEFAKKTLFKKKIAHGLLSVALGSDNFMKLLGNGFVLLKISFSFFKPISINEPFDIILEVIKKNNENKTMVLKSSSTTKDGLVGEGELIVKYFL